MNNIANIIQNSKTIYENKINNQTSLFSDDGQKVSYLIRQQKILPHGLPVKFYLMNLNLSWILFIKSPFKGL